MASTDSQTVNITVPKALLKRVDALAKRDYTSRSDIIRQALLDKIRNNNLAVVCPHCGEKVKQIV